MGRERDRLFQRAYIKILAFFKLLLFFLWIFLVLVCSDELRLNDLYFFRGKKKAGGFPGGSDSKESACNAGYQGLIPTSGRSPLEEDAAQSHILGWIIPRAEETGGLQSVGLQRVRQDRETDTLSKKRKKDKKKC